MTDYQLETEESSSNMMVPFKNSPISALSDPRSLLEVVAHQDYGKKILCPLVERKFINLNHFNE